MQETHTDILKGVPLAELHCHLEATVSPGRARALAARNAIDISGVFDEAGAYRWRTFNEFLDTYDAVSEAIRTPEDYYDITLDHYRRIAADGVIYAEVIVSPAHAGRFGLSYQTLMDAVARAMQAAEHEVGIVGRIIATCIRHLGGPHATETAETVAAHPHPHVTGFGMAGDEAFGNASDYDRAFAIAKDAGLGLSAHAGEIIGPHAVLHAIDHFRVDRIGHGVTAVQDEGVMVAIKENDITLEVCPTSNVAIGLYPDLQSHPLPILMNAGIAVTLNSDDPAYFHVTLAEEYERNAKTHGLSRADLIAMTRTAVSAAFCDRATKKRLLDKVDAAY